MTQWTVTGEWPLRENVMPQGIGYKRRTINGMPGRPIERMTQPLGGSHSGDVATARRRGQRRQSLGTPAQRPPGQYRSGYTGSTGDLATLGGFGTAFSMMPLLGTTNLGPDFMRMFADQSRISNLQERLQAQQAATDERTGMDIPQENLFGMGGGQMAPPASRIGNAQRLAQQNFQSVTSDPRLQGQRASIADESGLGSVPNTGADAIADQAIARSRMMRNVDPAGPYSGAGTLGSVGLGVAPTERERRQMVERYYDDQGSVLPLEEGRRRRSMLGPSSMPIPSDNGTPSPPVPLRQRQLGQSFTENQAMAQRAYAGGSIPQGGAGFVGEGPVSGGPRSSEMEQRLDAMRQRYGIGGRLGDTADFGTSSTIQATPDGGVRIRGTGYRPRERSPVLGGGIPTMTTDDGSVVHRDPRTGEPGTPAAIRADMLAAKQLGRLRRNAARRAGVPFEEGMSFGDIQQAQRSRFQQGLEGGAASPSRPGTQSSSRERMREALLDEPLNTEPPAPGLQGVEMQAETQAQTLFDQWQNGDRTEAQILAKAAELEGQLPEGVSVVELLNRMVQEHKARQSLRNRPAETSFEGALGTMMSPQTTGAFY